MRQEMWPVDVICLTAADGQIRPLRIRAEQGVEETVVGNVCEILSARESRIPGAEYYSFLCRVRCRTDTSVLELRYFNRSHSWYMFKPFE